MQIFFLNGLCRLLKNGHLPVKLHSSAPAGLLNLFLQLVYVRFYSRVFPLRVLSPKPTFHLNSAKGSSEIGLLSCHTLLDFEMALSTAMLIAVTIKSAYLSKSLVDRSPKKSAEPSASLSVDSNTFLPVWSNWI